MRVQERTNSMENTMDNKNTVSSLMHTALDKIREMADTNTIVGQPITTPDGVTLIPISKLSFGFGGGSGGGDYVKSTKGDRNGFGGGGAAGVKIDPVAFLVIKDGITRVLPVAVPPASTVDRIVEMAPDIMDKVEKYFDKKKGTETL
jgi:sporulation protein YtfJ